MNTIDRHRGRWVLILALGLALGATIAILSLFRDGSEARSVQLRDGDVVSASVSAEDALARASKSAGFAVVSPKDPGKIVDGLGLENVWVQPAPPPGPPGAPPRTFRVVTLNYAGPGVTFSVDELNGGFDPTTSGERLTVSNGDVAIYVRETETGVSYSMLARERGFILNSEKPNLAPRDAAVTFLLALARELE